MELYSNIKLNEHKERKEKKRHFICHYWLMKMVYFKQLRNAPLPTLSIVSNSILIMVGKKVVFSYCFCLYFGTKEWVFYLFLFKRFFRNKGKRFCIVMMTKGWERGENCSL